MASLIKASTAMQRLRWLPGKPTALPSPINVIVKEDVGASAKRLKIDIAIFHVSIAWMGIAIHGHWKNGKFNEEISQLNKEKAQLSKEKAKRDQEVHEETTDCKKLIKSVNEIKFLIRQFGLKEREDKGAEV